MVRALVVSLLVLWGCASRGVDPVMLREPPADLSMDVVVFTPEPGTAGVRHGARYVLEADGVLRAAIGIAEPRRVFPGHSRRLTPGQVSGVWRLVVESGLLDEDSPARVNGPGVFRPARDRTIALFTVRFAGETRSFRATLDREGEEAAKAGAIVERLAALAWAS